MDRRQLENFLAVVDYGTMSRAAAHLMVSQPSVSQTIRLLERQIGAQLFDRSGGELTLTDAATALIAPARSVMMSFVSAERSVAQALDRTGGRLKLTIPAILAVHPGVTLVARCALAWPDLEFRIQDQTSVSSVWDAVASGRSELGFVTTLEVPSMKAILLGRHTLVAVFPPGTSECEQPMTMKDMTQERWIAGVPLGFHTRNVLGRALAREGLSMTRRVETAHRQAIPQLVLAGLGPALVIREEADELAQFGAVVRDTDPVWIRPYYLIHRRERLSPAAQAFVDVATTFAPSVPTPSPSSPTTPSSEHD